MFMALQGAKRYRLAMIRYFCLAVFALMASVAKAQSGLPDTIYYWTERRVGAAHRAWSITADGAVKINGERCSGCRWHAPYASSHTIDPKQYREIASLLQRDVLKAAASSPCTLPRGDRAYPVEVFDFHNGATGVTDRVTLMTACMSPQMEIALSRITDAHTIIAKIEGQ
jgi:hypothetical protein